MTKQCLVSIHKFSSGKPLAHALTIRSISIMIASDVEADFVFGIWEIFETAEKVGQNMLLVSDENGDQHRGQIPIVQEWIIIIH